METEEVVIDAVDEFGARAALRKACILLDAEIGSLKRFILDRDTQIETLNKEIQVLNKRIEKLDARAHSTKDRVEHEMKKADRSLILMVWSWLISGALIAVYMLNSLWL